MIASATRLHLRSARYLIPFMFQVNKVNHQVQRSAGMVDFDTRKTQGFSFWTRTVWESEEQLMAFQCSNAHHHGKPDLAIWCDEAVHVHWDWDGEALPSWEECETALAGSGRLSKLNNPSDAQARGEVVLT